MSALAEALRELARFLHASDPVLVGVTVAVLAGACLYGSWRTWRYVGQVRLIEDTPTARIRSAPQGYVELEGVGRPMDGGPIVAKLSGLPCVWYRYLIEKKTTTYDDRGRAYIEWEIIDRGESTDTFWLEDATGRVVVDPEGAQINPRHKDRWRSNSSLGGIGRVGWGSQFAGTQGFGGTYRLTEYRLNAGEPLYALGLLKNVGSFTGQAAVEDDVRALLQEWKRDQPTLKARFDLNRDGTIDELEWRLARAQARREVRRNRRELTAAFSDGLNVLGPTHDRARPYILSAFTQAELVRRYQRWAALYAAACFAFGVAAVWVFNAKFV